MGRLEQQLAQLQQNTESGSGARVGPVNLTPAEQDWLERRSDARQLAWENQVRRAATRC